MENEPGRVVLSGDRPMVEGRVMSLEKRRSMSSGSVMSRRLRLALRLGTSWSTRRRSLRVAVGVCLLLLAVGESLAAESVRVVVFPLQPLGVDSVKAHVASLLLRDYLQSSRRFEIIPSDRGCYYASCASEIASELSAQKAIIGKLAMLGESLLVSLSLIDVRSGRVEFSDRLKATSEEDLDVVLERAAVGVSEKRRFRDTIGPERITEQETAEPLTRKTLTVIGIRTGYQFPVGESFGGSRGMFMLSFMVHHETAQLVAEGGAGFATAPGAQDLYLEVLVHRMLSTRDFAPYVGAGLGVHRFSFELDRTGTGDGLGLSLAAGLVGFRTYDFRVILDCRYRVIFTMNDLPAQQGLSTTFGVTMGR